MVGHVCLSVRIFPYNIKRKRARKVCYKENTKSFIWRKWEQKTKKP
jgi:hypothetical protein